MLVTWCSTTGAPGVSAWSVLTAGVWPADATQDIVVVEADRTAGVMASRYSIGVVPGSAELVVAASEGGPIELGGVGRKVSDNAWLVPGPVVPSEANAVWNDHNANSVANVVRQDQRMWFVDAGRFDSGTWVWHEQSALTVVLVPAWTDALVSAQSVVTELGSVGRTRVMVVGKPDYRPEELSSFLGAQVTVLPTGDVVGESTAVWGGSGFWRRGAVWDTASRLAAEFAELGALVGGAT